MFQQEEEILPIIDTNSNFTFASNTPLGKVGTWLAVLPSLSSPPPLLGKTKGGALQSPRDRSMCLMDLPTSSAFGQPR